MPLAQRLTITLALLAICAPGASAQHVVIERGGTAGDGRAGGAVTGAGSVAQGVGSGGVSVQSGPGLSDSVHPGPSATGSGAQTGDTQPSAEAVQAHAAARAAVDRLLDDLPVVRKRRDAQS